MQVFVIVVLVLAALLQVQARFISNNEGMPKFVKDTIEQSRSCALQVGSKASNLPSLQGMNLPEDNESLNELSGCIFVKKGLVNLHGDIDADILRTYLIDMFSLAFAGREDIREKANEITEICKEVVGANYGIKSVRLQNCINREMQERMKL